MDAPQNSFAKRLIERRLLIFSLVIVLLAVALVYLGKEATVVPIPPDAVNINAATSDELGRALAVSSRQADAIVAYRNGLPGGAFATTFALRHCPPLKNTAFVWQSDRYYVRDKQSVLISVCVCALFFTVIYLVLHGVLTVTRSQADPFLLPIVALLTGLGLAVIYTVKDPYRDTFAFFAQAKGVCLFGAIAFLIPFLKGVQRLPFHRYAYVYALGAMALLALLLVLGRGPAGTRIEVFGVEPIEFIKVFLVFFVAAYLAERRISPGVRSRRSPLPGNLRELLPLIAIYLFALTLFGAVKDLGPAVLLFGTFVLMLYLVTGNGFYPLAGMVLLVAAAIVGDKLGVGFFATRVQMWLHPWGTATGSVGSLRRACGGWRAAASSARGSALAGRLMSRAPDQTWSLQL